LITTNVILIYDDLPKLCAEKQGVKRIFAEGYAGFAISANTEIAIGGNSYFSLIYVKFKFCLAHIIKHNTRQ